MVDRWQLDLKTGPIAVSLPMQLGEQNVNTIRLFELASSKNKLIIGIRDLIFEIMILLFLINDY